MSDLLPRVAELSAKGEGYRRIAQELGISGHEARKALTELKFRQFSVKPIGALALYESVCRTLAEAGTVQEALSFHDEMDHVKLYARKVKDRELLAKATEWQTRAERRLGELLCEAERLGWIGPGRPKETVPDEEHFTLEEAGIDRKLSARAQKLAEISPADFEQRLGEVRERIISRDAAIINGARAVLAGRQEPDDSLDYFPTPPWATRALIETVLPEIGIGTKQLGYVWEPACGEGHMAEVLAEYTDVSASDVFDYGYGTVEDFLKATQRTDWIISNPPFGEKATEFISRALTLSTNLAMFLQLRYLEGIGRYEAIFQRYPPTLCAFFVERVNLCKGRWEPDGTTATAYCWLVWISGKGPRPPFWIPPGQREALTRPDDAERFTQHPVQRASDRVAVPVTPSPHDTTLAATAEVAA